MLFRSGNKIQVAEVADGNPNDALHAYMVVGYETEIRRGNAAPGSDTQVFTGVKRDILIDLKGGDNFVEVTNDNEARLALEQDCHFAPPNGGNATDISSGTRFPGFLFIPRDLSIKTGNGNDEVAILANVRTATVNTGKGADAVLVGDALFRDDLLVNTGDGDDHVCLQAIAVKDFLNVQTGNGNDEVMLVPHTIPSGLQSHAGHALVVTGDGNDRVGLFQFGLDQELTVDTSGGMTNDQDNVAIQFFKLGGQLDRKSTRLNSSHRT